MATSRVQLFLLTSTVLAVVSALPATAQQARASVGVNVDVEVGDRDGRRHDDRYYGRHDDRYDDRY